VVFGAYDSYPFFVVVLGKRVFCVFVCVLQYRWHRFLKTSREKIILLKATGIPGKSQTRGFTSFK